MSRRHKFSKEKKEQYLDELRRGARRMAAAESVGINRETARAHYNADPEFAAAVEQAEMDANELIEDALFQAAESGNVVACQVWLYNRMPDRWKDKRNYQVNIGNKDIDSAIHNELEKLAGRQEGGDAGATAGDESGGSDED